jgi:hypothetical protein
LAGVLVCVTTAVAVAQPEEEEAAPKPKKGGGGAKSKAEMLAEIERELARAQLEQKRESGLLGDAPTKSRVRAPLFSDDWLLFTHSPARVYSFFFLG